MNEITSEKAQLYLDIAAVMFIVGKGQYIGKCFI